MKSREAQFLERANRRASKLPEAQHWVYLTTPLTSTSWDGDARSTTAKTLIDLSAVFAVPAGVRAVLVYVSLKDSGSAGTDCYLVLAPNDTANQGMFFNADRSGDDRNYRGNGVIPCDANGDIYFQVAASGAATCDVRIEVWGYLL